MSDNAQQAPCTVPPLVRFSESFTGTAKSKLEFLQGMGGRVVSLVLEDCDGMTATIDRWGKVTWADKPNSMISLKDSNCKPEKETVK